MNEKESLKLQPVENMSNGHQPTETVELDVETAVFLSEIENTMRPLQIQMQTALHLFIRRNHLDGQWRLNPDGRSISRVRD